MASDNASAKYHLFSTEGGNQNVGVWVLKDQEEEAEAIRGQPVRVGTDLLVWTVTPRITVRGPYKLGVYPYKYTGVVNREVFATNNSGQSQEFTILPIEGTKDHFYISPDTVGNEMWTAQGEGKPIMIDSFTGRPNQVFRFVPVHR